MKKARAMAALFMMAIAVTACLGCAKKNSPNNSVLSFISAVHVSSTADIDKTLSFERLLIEKEGETYLKTPPKDKAKAVADFRNNILKQLSSGDLKYLGNIDPKPGSETITDDKAEVVVYDRKNNNKGYIFTLSREEGVWKIYRMTSL